ncbi:MAG: 4Fe-4S ferredoxin [Firmicutes bacterium]|nr:4Fe-4S ferredoxin [Bacillota bacterium]
MSNGLMNRVLPAPAAFQPLKALLCTIPMLLLSAMMLSHGSFPTEPLQRIALGLTYIFCNGLFFLMLYTGKVHRYRSVFFITAAFAFIISFGANLLEVRGSMVLNEANIIDGDTPFCHLVIPMVIIPAALTKTIIFPGTLLNRFASIAGMVVLWLGASVALGRGWCSWVCFYGGLDEGFSRLCKKPVISDIDTKWTYLPWAVLLGIVLTSALTLSPTYCEWLCPFKTVTEFGAITSFKTLIQTVIFVTLFLALVVVLPIITGRRIQCGLFCPFAAFQSVTNKFNIFDIRIDREKCVDCNRCSKGCPTFSLDEASIREGKTLLSCTKCGKCVDICPRQAIRFHIKGTSVSASAESARLLFLYPAFIFATAVGGGMVYGAMVRVLKLVTTGSMF